MLLKNGAKQAEMDWMGFDELPEKLTKADIQNWIDENRIEVEEVVKGSKKDWVEKNNERLNNEKERLLYIRPDLVKKIENPDSYIWNPKNKTSISNLVRDDLKGSLIHELGHVLNSDLQTNWDSYSKEIHNCLTELKKKYNPTKQFLFIKNSDFNESIAEFNRMNDVTQLDLSKNVVIKGELKSPFLKTILYNFKTLYYFRNTLLTPKLEKLLTIILTIN
jgi:gas vesicle protein